MHTKKYLVLDCETSTFPIEDYTKEEVPEEIRRKIALAKPLIYDLAWLICDRTGTIYKSENIIIPEVFYNPALFKSAYYAEKRPIYNKAIANGDFKILPFDLAIETLIKDCQTVNYTTAYNAYFDYKCAIPFTQKYLHRGSFYENMLKEYVHRQITGEKMDTSTLPPTTKSKNQFEINGHIFPLVDIWGEVVEKVLNCDKFKKWAIKNNKYNRYFSTSAETAYSYITNNAEYKEQHTALEDCKIEKELLCRAISRRAITYTPDTNINRQPFRILGTVNNYLGEG